MTIILILLIWLISMLTFGLGYFLGSIKHSEDLVASVKTALKSVKKASPGIVRRPTAERIETLSDPKKKESEEAGEEIFDKLLQD